jgi:hypothetical protein
MLEFTKLISFFFLSNSTLIVLLSLKLALIVELDLPSSLNLNFQLPLKLVPGTLQLPMGDQGWFKVNHYTTCVSAIIR